MAQLIDWLAGSGARNADGTAVSSGLAWFYEVGGGTTSATVYADVDGTVIATQPVALDAAGRAVVYTIEPVRALVQDATGVTVLDVDDANVNRAEAVQVDNASWTAGYLDDVLTAIGASTGGADGQYLESGGATVRSIQSKFSELSISVKDFGAKGDGLAIDTTVVQAAVNRVGFLGGGEVYFPPGNYLIDQPITSTLGNVSLRGAGVASQITNTSSIGDLLHFAASQFGLRGLYLTQSSGTSSGCAVKLTTCGHVTVSNLTIDSHSFGVAMTSSSNVTIENTTIVGSLFDAAALPIKLTDSEAFVSGSNLVGGTLGSIAFYAGSLASTVVGCYIGGSVGVTFDSALTGTGFKFTGNRLPATAFVFNGATMPKGFYQAGNGVDGYKGGLLTGATFTPDLSKGYSITIDATTTGSAYTVAVPTPPPSAVDYGIYLDLVFYAHAGGAITGWGAAAGYHTSSGPSTTDTNRTSYRFHWDPDNSVWREVSRSVTT